MRQVLYKAVTLRNRDAEVKFRVPVFAFDGNGYFYLGKSSA
jgi:hypothetical protein